MSTDLREHALRLLQSEATHSLPIRLLRERLSGAPGEPPPTAGTIERELARDPRFRLLRAPAAGAAPEFAVALEAAGMVSEVRVVLAENPGEAAAAGTALLGGTRGTLLAALERNAALAPEIAAALGELEEMGKRLYREEVTAAAAAPSTTPPPGPRAPARSRPRWRPPASAPLPPGGCRSG